MLVCSGSQEINVDFRAGTSAVLLQDQRRISQQVLSGNLLITGSYTGEVLIYDVRNEGLLYRTVFEGQSSAVPVGGIRTNGSVIYAAAHWDKIKRICTQTFTESKMGGFGSIYGVSVEDSMVATNTGFRELSFD